MAKGEVAILSEVDKLENIFKASGKFGGVAGVFAGVISCKNNNQKSRCHWIKSHRQVLMYVCTMYDYQLGTYRKSSTIFIRYGSFLKIYT